MSESSLQSGSHPHHFEIVRNARGFWVAQDREGLIGGVFRTEKDAVRFALFEVEGDSGCVQVLPKTPSKGRESA